MKKFQKAFRKSKLARYISFAFISSLKTKISIRLLSHNVSRQVQLGKVGMLIFFDVVFGLILQNFQIYCFVSMGLLYISIMFHLLFFAWSTLSFLFVKLFSYALQSICCVSLLPIQIRMTNLSCLLHGKIMFSWFVLSLLVEE